MSEEKVPKEPKPPKAKKKPSDFEIVRTILTRTHERKLPYLLKNMGEDPDILLFCSEEESDFTYGSSEMSIAIFEFTDPELKIIVETCLSKLHGLDNDIQKQLVINVRDQMSELSKTKGETIECEVSSNEAGSVWNSRVDVRGQERIVYFAKAVESLYHFQVVREWNKSFRKLLTTTDPKYLYYPYEHLATATSTIGTFGVPTNEDNDLAKCYPHGFRTMLTKGIDVAIGKTTKEFPYPVIKEEMIFFSDNGCVCHMAHRIEAQGWRMIILRPNMTFIPPLHIPIPDTGHNEL